MAAAARNDRTVRDRSETLLGLSRSTHHSSRHHGHDDSQPIIGMAVVTAGGRIKARNDAFAETMHSDDRDFEVGRDLIEAMASNWTLSARDMDRLSQCIAAQTTHETMIERSGYRLRLRFGPLVGDQRFLLVSFLGR